MHTVTSSPAPPEASSTPVASSEIDHDISEGYDPSPTVSVWQPAPHNAAVPLESVSSVPELTVAPLKSTDQVHVAPFQPSPYESTMVSVLKQVSSRR